MNFMRLMKTLKVITLMLLVVSCSENKETITATSDKEVKLKVNNNYKNAPRTIFLHNTIDKAFVFYKNEFTQYTYPTVTLALLTQAEWGNGGGPPFGVPNYDEEVREIRLGVTKDATANAMGYPVPETDTELAEIDKIMIHELGHYFFKNVAQINQIESFSWEFMATYFALDYLNQNTNGWDMDTLKQANEEQINYRTIEDFNSLYVGVGVENYDWYQRQFLILAKRLYNVKGKGMIDDYIVTYKDPNVSLPFIDYLKQQDDSIVTTWLTELETNL